jgi:YbbR domain-containing protein
MMTSLRKLVFEDFWLKLFSLVLAVLMWFTISSAIRQGNPSASPLGTESQILRTFSQVPVVVLSSAPQTGRFKIQPETVELTVEGTATSVHNLQDSDISVIVDLTGIETAHDLLKRLKVSKPAGIAKVKVVPEEVQVTYSAKN